MAVKKYQILQKQTNDNLIMHPETDASIVVLDNSSGHYQGQSTNVQNALEEVYDMAIQAGGSSGGGCFVGGVATDVYFTSDPQTQIGNLSSLATTEKNSLVGAINEVKSSIAGLEEIVLFDKINNNKSAIKLSTKTPINLANYGLVGGLKDYKYLGLTYSDGDSPNIDRTTCLIRLDQALLNGEYTYYDSYPVLIPYFNYIDTKKYAIGNYELELNASNQIKVTRENDLFGNSSTLTTFTNTSSIVLYISKIVLLK